MATHKFRDLAALCLFLAPLTLVAVSNAPITHFAPPVLLGPGSLVAVANFDANSASDLLIRDGSVVYVQLNGGAVNAIPYDLSNTTFFAVGDFNGDGKSDLAVVTNGT